MRPSLLLGLLVAFSACATPASADRGLRLLTLNIQIDGKGRLPGLIDLIKRSGADVVAMQEVDTAGPEIAKRLGWKYARFNEDTAVVSRYDLAPGPGRSSVKVRLANGVEVVVMDLHLYHAPYQPFQLLGIPYENGKFIKTEAEAISESRAARGKDVDEALSDLAQAGADDPNVIVVGDFNEPSHLDWTDKTAAVKRHPLKVAWPSTKAFADAGFKDAYRTLHPDEMAHPGFTWTPGLDPNDPKDHADRIDFILYRGAGLRPASAEIVGEDAAHADLVVSPYPTDHRGVVSTFTLVPPAHTAQLSH